LQSPYQSPFTENPLRPASSIYHLFDPTEAVSPNSPSDRMAPRSSSHSPGHNSPPTLGKPRLDRPRPSKVRSILPLHLEWEEERMLMLTLAQQAHYMRQLCWLSSIPKPGLPSLEYPPSPVRMRTSLTVLPIAPHRSLTRLKLIARGSHLTESMSTFPITTPAPAQRFMSNGPMTMAPPTTDY